MSAWERRYLEDATETALAEESDDLEVVDGEGGFRVCIGVFGGGRVDWREVWSLGERAQQLPI